MGGGFPGPSLALTGQGYPNTGFSRHAQKDLTTPKPEMHSVPAELDGGRPSGPGNGRSGVLAETLKSTVQLLKYAKPSGVLRSAECPRVWGTTGREARNLHL